MESIWTKTTMMQETASLLHDVKVEAVVIGAGLTGILTAYFLQKSGIDVIVLEADKIGSGQTKNTTAKITSQHNLIYAYLIEKFGEEKARQYADANESAIREFKELIEERHIECYFKECASYLYTKENEELLQKEAKAANALGIAANIVTQTELPFPVAAALRFDKQAQFHPLLFLKELAKELIIYERTLVTDVKKDELTVINAEGVTRKVSAKHIVLSTHYPIMNIPGYYFLRVHQERSYVIALKNAMTLQNMYMGIDKNAAWSFRSFGDTLLFGGQGHRTGNNIEGGQYGNLRKEADYLWHHQTMEIAHWSAQDCVTIDGIPYIGNYSAAEPNWYVATGYAKWGMTTSMLAAHMITDAINGRQNPYTPVFSPERFQLSASAKQMIDDGMHISKGLFKGAFLAPPRCPHLGCQLEWNPEEMSWDCPCHGSRFDAKGNILDNPAKKNIKDKELPW